MSLEEIFGKQINSIKELRAGIKELQNSLLNLDKDSVEYKQTTEKLVAAQYALRDATKAGAQENANAADSVYGLQKQYRELYDQYKKLTEAERNSPFGKNMAYELKQLAEQINDTKKGVGDFTANIGHYADDITKAFNTMGISVGGLQGPLRLATAGSKGLNDAWKAITKNPLLTVITGVVAILSKAASRIKENKEMTDRLHNAMLTFKPILDGINKLFDDLADFIVDATVAISDFIAKLSGPKMQEAIRKTREMAAAQRELNEANKDADPDKELREEIEKYKELAQSTKNRTDQQRYLNKAKKLQLELDDKAVKQAQSEIDAYEHGLNLAEKHGERVIRNIKMEQDLNDNLTLAELRRTANQEKLNSLIKNEANNVKEVIETVDSAKTAAEQIYERTVDANKDEITLLTEKYEEEKALLEKYDLDTYLLTQQYYAKLSEIYLKQIETRRKEQAEEVEFQDYLDTQLEDNLDKFIDGNKLAAKSTKEAWMDMAVSITSVFDSLSNSIENLIQTEIDSGNITEEQAKKKQKALEALRKITLAVSIAAITADVATGIAKVWANQKAEAAAYAAKYAASPIPGSEAIAAGLIAASKIRAATETASLAGMGVSQIAAAIGGYISKNSAGNGGSTVEQTTPVVEEPNAWTYTRNIQTQEDIDNLNQRPVWVSIVDVENALGQQVQIRDESSF